MWIFRISLSKARCSNGVHYYRSPSRELNAEEKDEGQKKCVQSACSHHSMANFGKASPWSHTKSQYMQLEFLPFLLMGLQGLVLTGDDDGVYTRWHGKTTVLMRDDGAHTGQLCFHRQCLVKVPAHTKQKGFWCFHKPSLPLIFSDNFVWLWHYPMLR